MLKTLVLLGALNCNPAYLVWKEKDGLNKRDLDHVSRLRKRCGKGRLADTPCLSYIRKVSELNYHVVCTFSPRKYNGN